MQELKYEIKAVVWVSVEEPEEIASLLDRIRDMGSADVVNVTIEGDESGTENSSLGKLVRRVLGSADVNVSLAQRILDKGEDSEDGDTGLMGMFLTKEVVDELREFAK